MQDFRLAKETKKVQVFLNDVFMKKLYMACIPEDILLDDPKDTLLDDLKGILLDIFKGILPEVHKGRPGVQFAHVPPTTRGVPGIDYSLDLGPTVGQPTPVSEVRPLWPGEPPPYLGSPGSEFPMGFPFHHFAKQFWPPTALDALRRPMTGALVRPTFSVNVGSAVRPPPPRSTTDVDEFVQLVMQVNASAAKSEGCAPAVSSKSEETKSKAGLQPTTKPCPKRGLIEVSRSSTDRSASSTEKTGVSGGSLPERGGEEEDQERPPLPRKHLRRYGQHGRAEPLHQCKGPDSRAFALHDGVCGDSRALALHDGVCGDSRAEDFQQSWAVAPQDGACGGDRALALQDGDCADDRALALHGEARGDDWALALHGEVRGGDRALAQCEDGCGDDQAEVHGRAQGLHPCVCLLPDGWGSKKVETHRLDDEDDNGEGITVKGVFGLPGLHADLHGQPALCTLQAGPVSELQGVLTERWEESLFSGSVQQPYGR